MKITTWLLAITAMATALQASASNNTISFQGEVTEQTCNVTVNGSSNSPIVLLPTVSTKQLETAASAAGLTMFEIAITGCENLSTATAISTVLVGNNVTTDGNLGNTGTAENVELQILQNDGQTNINLNTVFKGEEDLTLSPGQTGASSNYYVQYYSTGKASAGTVLGSLQYAISYL